MKRHILLGAIALLAAACTVDPVADETPATTSCEGPCPAPRTCGVGLPSMCNDGDACAADADCTGDYCDVTCKAPPAGVHEDGRRNAGETGIDCGGTATAKCPGGQRCATSDDCQGLCEVGTCAAPDATDAKKNGDESDVDCGGTSAPKCVRGKACTVDADCQLLTCASSVCATPAADDAVKNGGESDVDCGGAGVSEGSFAYTPPRCNDYRACVVDADCTSGACSPTGQCVSRSCDTAETAGITTCGTGEVDGLTKSHETCCKSLPLPNRGLRLDKYEITAGRYRAFIEAVGPNIRQFVASYAAANPSSQLKELLTKGPNVADIFPAVKTGAPLGLVAHLAFDIDNYNGTRGCYNGAGSYGHNTYWQDANDLSEYGIPARPLPRVQTDVKSLNCAMPIMLMAFCAWDGGELATLDDYKDAWGATRYPWGDTPVPDTAGKPSSTNYNWCNGEPGNGGFACQNTALGDNGNFYAWPVVGDAVLMNDRSPWIASPGRFPLDATDRKAGDEPWFDLFANMAEFTGDISASSAQTFCDFSAAPAAGATTCTRNLKDGTGTLYTNIPNVGLVGRSWEGHAYDAPGAPGSLNAWPSTAQYGKFGGRCVRPLQ